MEDKNNNHDQSWSFNLTRFMLYIKRRIKLNRFLLVIDTKKGVSISAVTVIVRERLLTFIIRQQHQQPATFTDK